MELCEGLVFALAEFQIQEVSCAYISRRDIDYILWIHIWWSKNETSSEGYKQSA